MSSSPDNGYAAITNYEVYWNNGIGTSASTLKETTTSYTRAYTVTEGKTYYFKVRALNKHGNGAFSSEVNSLAAAAPEKMTSVVSSETTSATTVTFTWTEPTINGDAISAYRIKFLNRDSGAYVE